MVKNTPFMNSSIIRMDSLMGNSNPNPLDKWWFDLEEVEGKYQKPSKDNKGSSSE
jgi:hypothetical protein